MKTNGIYFRQVDVKEVGYYIEDKDGDLIHQKYKKPTFWERTKYFAKYGYEMNLETIETSFFLFRPDRNELHFETRMGDAISTAKWLKNRGNVKKPYVFLLDADRLTFETKDVMFELRFSSDKMYLFVQAKFKKNEKLIPSETFTFLDWNRL
jgi:hypothetical protein